MIHRYIKVYIVTHRQTVSEDREGWRMAFSIDRR